MPVLGVAHPILWIDDPAERGDRGIELVTEANDLLAGDDASAVGSGLTAKARAGANGRQAYRPRRSDANRAVTVHLCLDLGEFVGLGRDQGVAEGIQTASRGADEVDQADLDRLGVDMCLLRPRRHGGVGPQLGDAVDIRLRIVIGRQQPHIVEILLEEVNGDAMGYRRTQWCPKPSTGSYGSGCRESM